MINFFGIIHQSGGCGPELLGAIELLRSKGVPVRCIVPEGDAVSRGDRADFLRSLGCSVVNYRPGLFDKCKVLVSFGEDKMFDYMREHSDRPAWVVWSSCMAHVVSAEVEAMKDGLIDEWFFQTPANAQDIGKKICTAVGKGTKLAFRNSYRPYIKHNSSFMLLCNPTRSDEEFVVGRATRDDPAKWHDDSWRMYSSILAPSTKPVRVEVAGWGDVAQRKVGNPCDPSSRWNGFMNITLRGHIYDPAEIASFYGRIHTLVHYYPFTESFGISTAQAMLCGAVPIGANARGFQEQITHGETGFLCDSPDEAAFYASTLAFDDVLRSKMSDAARESALNDVANPDKAWLWWKTLVAERTGITF